MQEERMNDDQPSDTLGDLQRFVAAQQGVYDDVLAQLRAGQKASHWMWFIFPQLRGLGHSQLSLRYAISDVAEATAYLDHPVLGNRLRECTQLVNAIEGRGAREIFGYPDFLKFRSCMTLFGRATEDRQIFAAALNRYFEGEEDPVTLRLLRVRIG